MKTRTWAMTTLALVAAVSSIAVAQDTTTLRDRLQSRFAELQAASGVPGATAAIVLADGRTITLAAGFADTSRKIVMTPQHRLHGGSTGKTFVAAIILQLVAEGRVGLDDHLSRWFSGQPW